jgi:hypothetical protein
MASVPALSRAGRNFRTIDMTTPFTVVGGVAKV